MAEFFRNRRAAAQPGTDFEHYASTHDHWRCLYEERGQRCGRPAGFLIRELARDNRAHHSASIRGGYCNQHWQRVVRGQEVDPPAEGQPWRERAILEYLRAHPEASTIPDGPEEFGIAIQRLIAKAMSGIRIIHDPPNTDAQALGGEL